MKLTGILIMATAMLLGLAAMAAAQETARPPGEFRKVSPEEMEQMLARQWWKQADEAIQQSIRHGDGTWLLKLTLFDDAGKLVGENEMAIQAGSVASTKSMPVAGQKGVGDFSTLDDYSILLWAMPPELDATFREHGWRDWPANHERIKVKFADGTPYPNDPIQLSDDQQRNLFAQMLDAAQVIELNGLRLYIFASRAEHVTISLDWVDQEHSKVSGGSGHEERIDMLREYSSPVADMMIHFDNGGQYSGGD